MLSHAYYLFECAVASYYFVGIGTYYKSFIGILVIPIKYY